MEDLLIYIGPQVVMGNQFNIFLREKLKDILRLFVNGILLEMFYGKRKKLLAFLKTFYISYESDIKNFLKKRQLTSTLKTHFNWTIFIYKRKVQMWGSIKFNRVCHSSKY